MTTDSDPEQNEEPEGPWEVTARWLFDLDVYNEWMNEEDYLVSDDEGNVSKRYSWSLGKVCKAHCCGDVP